MERRRSKSLPLGTDRKALQGGLDLYIGTKGLGAGKGVGRKWLGDDEIVYGCMYVHLIDFLSLFLFFLYSEVVVTRISFKML